MGTGTDSDNDGRDHKMSKKGKDQFMDDFALFIEAGFVAVNQVDEPSAKKLFYAAETLQQDHPAPKVGLGFIALNKLEVNEAVDLFKEALELDPEHQLAQAFLGISYMLKKTSRKEGEKLVNKIMAETDDPSVKNLCEVSLDWAKKDLKSKAAPFFATASEDAEEEKGE